MNLRQLEYLVAVVEEANFTRAAERLFVSQPGLSAMLRRLEDEVGAVLVDRSTRTAELTSAGQAALPHARAALAEVAAIGKAVEEVAGLVRGRLTAGMVVGCRVGPFFDALASFHQAHPGVELALREANSDQLIDGLVAGDLDLALAATAGEWPPEVEGFPIVEEPLVVVAPPEQPLVRRRRVRLRDVVQWPLVCLPAGTGIRSALEMACADAGLRAAVGLEAGAPDSVADLARRGLGVAVLSVSTAAAAMAQGGLEAVPIADAKVLTTLAVVWAKRPNPARDRLVDYTRTAFADMKM